MQPRASGKSQRGSMLMWFGVLGGGIAWSLHLVASYLLAESICVDASRGFELWGMSGLLILLITFTVVTGLVALAATLVSWGQWSQWRRDEDHQPAAYLTLTGLLLSGTFFVIILVQSLPLLFFGGC